MKQFFSFLNHDDSLFFSYPCSFGRRNLNRSLLRLWEEVRRRGKYCCYITNFEEDVKVGGKTIDLILVPLLPTPFCNLLRNGRSLKQNGQCLRDGFLIFHKSLQWY